MMLQKEKTMNSRALFAILLIPIAIPMDRDPAEVRRA